MLGLNSALDLQNALGFRKFYGISPAVNLDSFLQTPNSPRDKSILLYECIDLRHILETIASIKPKGDEANDQPITYSFYMVDESPANILRHMIMIKVLTDGELTDREKIESFLDFYWNIYITAKTLTVVERILPILFKEIPDNKVEFFNLSQLKYKDKDLLIEALEDWRKLLKANNVLQRANAEEKFTRDRVTALYKERWEHRKNLIDADYVWGIKDNSIEITKQADAKSQVEAATTQPCIHFFEYFSFRESGVAFQVHDTPENHKFINFTMLDYQSGRKKTDKTSCGVLGYWGDITTGPFPSIGIYPADPIQAFNFYTKRNDNFIHTSSQIAESNVQKFLTCFLQAINNKSIKFMLYPILKDDKKELTTVKSLFQKMDMLYLSSDVYQKFAKNIPEILIFMKEGSSRVIIGETLKFCAPIDLKKRAALKKLMIDGMTEIERMKLLKDLDHHLVYQAL